LWRWRSGSRRGGTECGAWRASQHAHATRAAYSLLPTSCGCRYRAACTFICTTMVYICWQYNQQTTHAHDSNVMRLSLDWYKCNQVTEKAGCATRDCVWLSTKAGPIKGGHGKGEGAGGRRVAGRRCSCCQARKGGMGWLSGAALGGWKQQDSYQGLFG
jgi:hypothetical protein